MTDAPLFDLVLDEGAESDLRGTASYLAEHRSREAARELVAAIFDKVATLEHFPARGARPHEPAGEELAQYRQILFGVYRIIYRIAGEQVRVLVVADSRRDMAALLRERVLGSDRSL